MARAKPEQAKEPVLEWIAAGLGLVLTLGIVAVIGREAMSGEAARPPAIEVRVRNLVLVDSGYLVEVAAMNRSGATAAEVQVEGRLMAGDTLVEASSLTLDYVPGHATRKGGLFFATDPRRHRLELRALGYQEP
jgi:uncharacterized protein (TIGR02588 family)